MKLCKERTLRNTVLVLALDVEDFSLKSRGTSLVLMLKSLSDHRHTLDVVFTGADALTVCAQIASVEAVVRIAAVDHLNEEET